VIWPFGRCEPGRPVGQHVQVRRSLLLVAAALGLAALTGLAAPAAAASGVGTLTAPSIVTPGQEFTVTWTYPRPAGDPSCETHDAELQWDDVVQQTVAPHPLSTTNPDHCGVRFTSQNWVTERVAGVHVLRVKVVTTTTVASSFVMVRPAPSASAAPSHSPSAPASHAPSSRPASSAPADPAELQSSAAQPPGAVAGGDYSSSPALSDSASGAVIPGWIYLAGVLLLLAGAGILVTVVVLHRRGDGPVDDDTAEYPLR